MRTGHWILKDGNPVEEPDLIKWAEWFESATNRVVKQEHVGNTLISTVFLGLDHNFGEGAPILWETMTFNDNRSEQDCDRCSGNWEQAEAMHEAMVERVKKKQNEISTLEQDN